MKKHVKTFLLLSFTMTSLLLGSCKKENETPATKKPVTEEAADVPPLTWQEHWFEHVQLLKRVYYNDHIAVYYDNDMPTNVTWPYRRLDSIWRYTKRIYGDFGADKRLFVILHENKYSGGHPSTYFDASHDYRNVIDVGLNGSWADSTGQPLHITAHEVGHIVEGASKGFHNSPAFPLWGDSKWMEIYQYDVYKSLGWTAIANAWYTDMSDNVDNFPVAGTKWFKNWFYPIYSQHGGTATLNKFFTLLAQYFPKNGTNYARNMNWGEFVHFWSGAAGVNLKAQATIAFGWPASWETQFQQARAAFPGIVY